MLKHSDWGRQNKYLKIKNYYNRMPNTEKNKKVEQLGKEFTKPGY
jgi:uncharacterized protein YxeA